MSPLADAADVLPGGIMGRILRIDLTTEQITVETLAPDVARMWLGGTGLGAKILYDEVPAGVEWDDPENRLILPARPLAGPTAPRPRPYSAVHRRRRARAAASGSPAG